MKLKVPSRCSECIGKRQLNDTQYICETACIGSEHPELDISTVYIDINADTIPDWCPIKEMNQNMHIWSEREKIAIRGLMTMFGAGNLFDEEDETVKPVIRSNGKHCGACDALVRYDDIYCRMCGTKIGKL